MLSFFCFIVLVSSQNLAPNDGCFQPGECTNSYHLASDFTTNEFASLENCNNEPLCSWFTFVPGHSFCQLLHNCSSIYIPKCPDCMSGQAQCVPKEPTCSVKGECKGNMLFLTEAEDQEECLQDCKDNLGCRWFTFHSFKSPKSMCILYYDCATLDETCDTCISGERRCEDGSTTTTTASTSTTTTTTPSSGRISLQFCQIFY